MLPAGSRLRHRVDFSSTVRGSRGVRGDGLLVVHLRLAASVPGADQPGQSALPPARAGLVVSRPVGDAVTRNRVKRRLRHLLRDRVTALPPGGRLVVRALPPSAGASSAALGAALDRALSRAAGHATGATRQRTGPGVPA